MLLKNEKRADAKISLRHLLTQKYGSTKLALINQALDAKIDLEFTDKVITELEKIIDQRIMQRTSLKSKSLVKPHIAKKLNEMKKVSDVSNTSVNRSTQLETDRFTFINQSNVNQQELKNSGNKDSPIVKAEPRKRLVSEKFDMSQRKRHTVLGLPSISGSEFEKNVDILKLVRENPKIQIQRFSLTRGPDSEPGSQVNNVLESPPIYIKHTRPVLESVGPVQHSRTKPKSLLKNSFSIKSPTHNSIFFNNLESKQLERVNSFNITDQVLNEIDKSIVEENVVKRGKSSGNFITGRDNNSLKRLVAQTSIEASERELSDIDMNLELDEIREIISGEGSFISQDVFKPKKQEKKDLNSANVRKSQNVNLKSARPVKRVSKLIDVAPKKPILLNKALKESKDALTPARITASKPPTLLKRSDNKTRESNINTLAPVKTKPSSGPELKLRNMASPPNNKKPTKFSFALNTVKPKGVLNPRKSLKN